MLLDLVARAYALRQHVLLTLLMLVSFQPLASVWVPIGVGVNQIFVPIPSLGSVSVEDYYQNTPVAMQLPALGHSTAVYYQVQQWQNGAFDETATWQCLDKDSVTQNSGVVDVGTLNNGIYRIKASAVMIEEQCLVASFEAGDLISSDPVYSQQFFVSDTDLSLSAINQKTISSYDMLANWPTLTVADSYKLGINRNNVWHYMDVSAADYDAAFAADSGWTIVDSFDDATGKFTPYTGFGDFSISVSYCIDGACSLPIVSSRSPVSVFPVFEYTSSVTAVAGDYALKLNFETDSRTPKFRFHQYVEYGDGPLDWDESMHDVIAPDAQTSYVTTNNGRTIAYERILPVSEPGDYQIYVEGCTTDFNCHHRYPLDILVTVLPEANRLTGGIDPFVPHYDYISGWVTDVDQPPEKVRLYHNDTYIQGTEVSTYTGENLNNRYFQIHNLEESLTAAGIDMNQPFSVELRALNWPSTTLYQTVQTININQYYNTAPVAVADAVFVSGDQPIVINVLANDYDAENNTLQLGGYGSYSAAGLPIENYHNNMVYTPDSSLGIDVDTFTYSNTDEFGRDSNVTTVSVIYSTVMAVADEVELQSTPVSAKNGFGRNVVEYSASVDVLANDYNLQNLPVTIEIVQQPSIGIVTVDTNNQVNINITGSPQGPVCFDYRMVTSAGSASNVVTSCGFTDDVFPAPDNYDITINKTTNLDVIENDTYTVRRSILDIELDTTNTQGTVTVYSNYNNHEMVRYTPPTDYVGGDSFRYQLTGYGDDSGYVTVSLNIGSSIPNTPTGLTAVATSDTSIDVSFNASSYAQVYYLQTFRSNSSINPSNISNASWLPINGSDFQRNYNLTDLDYGFHYYRVKACSNYGSTCSGWALSAGVELSNTGTGGGDGGGTIDQPDTESNPNITWPTTQDDVSAAVGTLGGSFRVNESGSATFQLPIGLIAGIGGVTPEVSLDYNSLGGGGALGAGWQLSAGGAISRCRQTFETDGEYQAIALDSSDRFCLNGQRLIAINNGVYGAEGTTYKTEVNSQQRVKSYGTSGTGPAYFTVEAADGSISYYGKYLTNTTGTIEASDETIVTWLLIKVVDNMGRVYTSNDNAIEYFYSHLADNEAVLDYITYSDNTVDFSYSTRDDISLQYSAGMLMANTQRLDTITVKNHLDQAINSYHLDYTAVSGMPNNATRMRSIKQCDGAIDGICKPATVFDWSKTKFQFPNTELTSLSVKSLSGVTPLEIDGDGMLDIAVLDKTATNSYTIKFLLNDRQGGFETTGAPSSIYLSHDSSTNAPKVTPVDINGDGITEIAVRYRSTGNGDYYWNLYTKSGNRYSAQGLLSDITSAYFTDITGDGLADLIYRDQLSNGKFGSKLRKNLGGTFAIENDAIEMPYPTLPEDVTANITAQVAQWTKNTAKFDFSGITTKSATQNLIQSSFLGSRVADFNGDGLADIVARMVHYSDTYQVNSDCDLEEEVTSYHVFKTVQTGSQLSFEYFTQIPGVEWYKDGRPAGTVSDQTNGGNRCDFLDESSPSHKGGQHFFDFNGDGMTDILYQDTSGGVWQLSYSTGIDFTAPVIPTGMTGKARNITFFDEDADGDADLIYTIEPDNSTSTVETHNWYIHKNTAGNFSTRQSFVRGGSFNAKEESEMFLDITGDGEVEKITINYADNEVGAVKNFIDNRSSRISKITDGLGNETIINYLPLTNDNVYELGTGAENLQYGNGSPVFDVIAPIYVVSNVVSSAPSYNSTGTTYLANNTVTVNYQYKGFRAQTGGRGTLGFEQLITYDPQSGITSDTTYRQDFPYIGMPIRSRQCVDRGLANCDGSARLLSIGLSFYNDEYASQPNTIDSDKVLVVYPHRKVTDTYQLNSDNSISFVNRVDNYTYQSEASDGGYMQVDSTANYVYGSEVSSGTPLSYQSVTNTYTDDNVANWWINRLSSSQATHTRANAASITRNASFEYYANTGLLKAEYVEPNSSNVSLFLKKAFKYDDFGNLTDTYQCSLANATSNGCAKYSTELKQVYRHESHVFDVAGRYLTESGDDLFNSTTTSINRIVTRDSLGLVTTNTDINGINNDYLNDSFGNLYATKNDIGNFKKITSRFAADKPAHWPFIDESYSVVTQVINAGSPVQYSYTDKRGLVVATVTQGFADNTWVVQYNRYDATGNMVRQSNPFFYGDTVYWASTEFDELNRIESITTADGNTTTTITYNGLTTSSQKVSYSSDYGEITQNSSQTKNRLGELLSVTDNIGSIIDYDYDSTGNVVTTTKSGVTISTDYDSYGRKMVMDDPDKGVWSYVYNVVGELVEQTDANGVITRYYIDSVGRNITQKAFIVENSIEVKIDQINNVYNGHLLVEQNKEANDYRKCYFYDGFGRSHEQLTIFDNRACPSGPVPTEPLKLYNQSVVFNGIGQLVTSYDATGQGVTNQYRNGYLYKKVEASNSSLLMEVLAMDASGMVTRSKDALNVETTKIYNQATGLIDSIVTDGGAIQNITYKFDGAGNLRNRNNISSNIDQDFVYDGLNRLTNVTGFMNQAVSYDANGNILTKSDMRAGASYNYDVNRPHAVASVGDMIYSYDDNGNQTNASDDNGYVRKIDYGYFDKPTLITMGNLATDDRTSFDYDTQNKRYKRVDYITNSDTNVQEQTTTYYVGNVEISQVASGTVFVKRYVANVIQTNGNNGTSSIRYTYKDHLGSLDAVVTANKKIASKLYFDPWGKRVALSKSDLSSQSQAIAELTLTDSIGVTTRGFTHHESIDHTGIIHMNGRIYDATLGRFLQADPFVQAPDNTQSYNRYSYVLNNPLRYTDPSGYFFKSVFKAVKKYWRVIAAAAVTYFTAGAASTWAAGWLSGTALAGSQIAIGAISGAIAGAAGGFVATGSFKGAFRGALSGAVFGALGGSFKAYGVENTALQMTMHGIAGGVLSDLQGGKFGHGFISSFISKGAGKINTSAELGRVLIQAMVGGTVSKLTGGKFANGAVTSAIQFIVNELSSNYDKYINKQKLRLKERKVIIEKYEKNSKTTKKSKTERVNVIEGANKVIVPDPDVFSPDSQKRAVAKINLAANIVDYLGTVDITTTVEIQHWNDKVGYTFDIIDDNGARIGEYRQIRYEVNYTFDEIIDTKVTWSNAKYFWEDGY